MTKSKRLGWLAVVAGSLAAVGMYIQPAMADCHRFGGFTQTLSCVSEGRNAVSRGQTSPRKLSVWCEKDAGEPWCSARVTGYDATWTVSHCAVASEGTTNSARCVPEMVNQHLHNKGVK
ncbi:MAG: hypothetical protein OXU20_31840 [Myxococcales bacterium]|nr:hypothetical protein [Myxococcales bacterium]